MRIAYATGSSARHGAFLDALTPFFPPALVIREAGPVLGTASPDVRRYREAVADAEVRMFPPRGAGYVPGATVSAHHMNDAAVIHALRDARPDLLVVFGSGLLGPETRSIPGIGSLNIHTGITQLFRGVDSAFWAIHEGRPEGIGATVHFVDATIDAGEVVVQARPELRQDDRLEDLFLRSVGLGFELMKLAVEAARDGKLAGAPLPAQGQLFRRADMTDQAVRRAMGRREPVLRDYLQDRVARDGRVALVGLPKLEGRSAT